ncbi:hypothetical protein ACWGCF_40805, partial [Streptomyces sp. NPDC055039]
EYLLGGATSASSFPVQVNPIGSLSGNLGAPQARALAERMAAEGPVELRALAAEIAVSGESCEQEPLHRKVLPRLVGLLEAVPAGG